MARLGSEPGRESGTEECIRTRAAIPDQTSTPGRGGRFPRAGMRCGPLLGLAPPALRRCAIAPLARLRQCGPSLGQVLSGRCREWFRGAGALEPCEPECSRDAFGEMIPSLDISRSWRRIPVDLRAFDSAGMAEWVDAADLKSAGPLMARPGSSPGPGTSFFSSHLNCTALAWRPHDAAEGPPDPKGLATTAEDPEYE